MGLGQVRQDEHLAWRPSPGLGRIGSHSKVLGKVNEFWRNEPREGFPFTQPLLGCGQPEEEEVVLHLKENYNTAQRLERKSTGCSDTSTSSAQMPVEGQLNRIFKEIRRRTHEAFPFWPSLFG